MWALFFFFAHDKAGVYFLVTCYNDTKPLKEVVVMSDLYKIQNVPFDPKALTIYGIQFPNQPQFSAALNTITTSVFKGKTITKKDVEKILTDLKK